MEMLSTDYDGVSQLAHDESDSSLEVSPTTNALQLPTSDDSPTLQCALITCTTPPARPAVESEAMGERPPNPSLPLTST